MIKNTIDFFKLLVKNMAYLRERLPFGIKKGGCCMVEVIILLLLLILLTKSLKDFK